MSAWDISPKIFFPDQPLENSTNSRKHIPELTLNFPSAEFFPAKKDTQVQEFQIFISEMESHKQEIETSTGLVVVRHPKAPKSFEDTCREIRGT